MRDQSNLSTALVTFIIAFAAFYAFGWMMASTEELFITFNTELPKLTTFLLNLSGDITPRITVSAILAGGVAFVTFILLQLDKIVFVVSFFVMLVLLLLGFYYLAVGLPVAELGEMIG